MHAFACELLGYWALFTSLMMSAGGQTRSAPSRPSAPSPRQSYSRPSAPIYSAPPIRTYHNDYITTFPLSAPAPSHYMGPATSFGFGSSSLFFIAFCMGCASMIAVNGFLSEKTFGRSLRAGTQTSSVLKLQVQYLFQFYLIVYLFFGLWFRTQIVFAII